VKTIITKYARRTALPLAALSCVYLAAACSGLVPEDTEAAKEKEAQEFYAEKLHTDEQTACNDRGFLYDNIAATCVDSIKLAAWTCERNALASRLLEVATADRDDAAGLATLDAKLDDGFEMHQCGEDDEHNIYLIIVKRDRTGDEATIEIERVALPAGGSSKPFVRFSMNKSAPEDVGNCQRLSLEHWAEVGFGGEARLEEVPVDADLHVSVHSTSASSITFYTDAKCSEEGKDFVIGDGLSSVDIYYSFSSEDSTSVVAEADGYEATEPESVGAVDLGPEDQTGTGTGVGPTGSAYLRFAIDSVVIGPVGGCNPVVIERVVEEDGELKSSPAAEDVGIAVSLDGAPTIDDAKIYSDEDCTMETGSVDLLAGRSDVTVYVKFTAANDYTIEADAKDYPAVAGHLIQAN
jgi:hypothetical protein